MDRTPIPGKPPHHVRGGFLNPTGSPQRNATFWEFLAFALALRRMGEPEIPPGHVLPPADVAAGWTRHGNAESVMWLGHAAFLMRIGGKTVLTDPYLSDYASPVPPFGPKRYVKPALDVASLPPIDVLLVSHNHYDHLDDPVIRALPGKERMQVVAPLKLGDFFRKRGYANVTELDWHESVDLGGVKVTAAPAVHFSARGLFDQYKTLWVGYAVESATRRVYFGGDSAYGPVFKDTGERLGPFDLAMIGIGAYEPRKIMKATHASPEEAIQIAQDLRARAVMGMHWGTILLTTEPPFEPPARFRAAAAEAGYAEDDAWILAVGETRAIPDHGAVAARPADEAPPLAGTGS